LGPLLRWEKGRRVKDGKEEGKIGREGSGRGRKVEFSQY